MHTEICEGTDPSTRTLGIQVERRNLLTDNMYKRMSIIEFSQNDHAKFFKKLQNAIDELAHRFEIESSLISDPLNKINSSTTFNDDSISLNSIESNPTNKATMDSVRKSKRIPKPKVFGDESFDQQSNKKKQKKNLDKSLNLNEDVKLGPHGTMISSKDFATINWESPSTATRKLLAFVFSNEILATHSLTGRPSPAFFGRERPLKNQLDPEKIADIICMVLSKTNGSEREIRAAITTKCADTTKKLKTKQRRKNGRFSI